MKVHIGYLIQQSQIFIEMNKNRYDHPLLFS